MINCKPDPVEPTRSEKPFRLPGVEVPDEEIAVKMEALKAATGVS